MGYGFKYSNAAIAITDTLSKAFYTKGISFFELNYLEDAEENFNEVIEIEGVREFAYRLQDTSLILKRIDQVYNHKMADVYSQISKNSALSNFLKTEKAYKIN